MGNNYRDIECCEQECHEKCHDKCVKDCYCNDHGNDCGVCNVVNGQSSNWILIIVLFLLIMCLCSDDRNGGLFGLF